MQAKALRYFALHEDGLRNGSFIREIQWGRSKVPKLTYSQFINGDYMGSTNEKPTTYADQPLVEFDVKRALKLIPGVCR